MHRVLHTLLLWLLIAALPIQGFAAAVNAACNAVHAAPDAAVTAFDHQDHRHAMEHMHAASAMQDDDADHGAPMPAATERGAHKHGGTGCACCVVAAAPPPALSGSFGPVVANDAIAPPLVPLAGHVPAALERPPRPLPL